MKRLPILFSLGTAGFLAFGVSGCTDVRPRREEIGGAEPWYSVAASAAREALSVGLKSLAEDHGREFSAPRLAFLFTQILAGGVLLLVIVGLAVRRWADDRGEALLRRTFLCLAWLWFLSATQNPWYWTWALPFVVFAPRPWLLVSGYTLIYYLRFWFISEFPAPVLVGGLDGRRFFDEVAVWVEHLPVLLLVILGWVHERRIARNSSLGSRDLGVSQTRPPFDAIKPGSHSLCQ